MSRPAPKAKPKPDHEERVRAFTAQHPQFGGMGPVGPEASARTPAGAAASNLNASSPSHPRPAQSGNPQFQARQHLREQAHDEIHASAGQMAQNVAGQAGIAEPISNASEYLSSASSALQDASPVPIGLLQGAHQAMRDQDPAALGHASARLAAQTTGGLIATGIVPVPVVSTALGAWAGGKAYDHARAAQENTDSDEEEDHLDEVAVGRLDPISAWLHGPAQKKGKGDPEKKDDQ